MAAHDLAFFCGYGILFVLNHKSNLCEVDGVVFSHQAIVELHDSHEHFFISIEPSRVALWPFFVIVVAKTGNFIEQLTVSQFCKHKSVECSLLESIAKKSAT